MLVNLVVNVYVVYTGALFSAAITVLIAFIIASACVLTLQFVELAAAIHHQGIKFTLEYKIVHESKTCNFIARDPLPVPCKCSISMV